MDKDLDKMADDIYNSLMGKSSLPKRSENYADRFEGLMEDVRKMGGEVPEDWRAMINGFADEFDAMLADDMEESDMYEFQFYFMPELAQTHWADASSREACLGDVQQILANAAQQALMIDPTGFKVTRKNQDGVDIYFYEFPKPTRAPMALYGVIIFGPKGGRYYTLEFERPGCYMVCNPTTEDHNNFGESDSTSKKEFLKQAISLYKNI